MKLLIFHLVLCVPVFATRSSEGVESQRSAESGTTQSASSLQKGDRPPLKSTSLTGDLSFGVGPSLDISRSSKATKASERGQTQERDRHKDAPQDLNQEMSGSFLAKDSGVGGEEAEKRRLHLAVRKEWTRRQRDARAADPEKMAKFKELRRANNKRYIEKLKADPERFRKYKETQSRAKERRNKASKASKANKDDETPANDPPTNDHVRITRSKKDKQKLPSWGERASRTRRVVQGNTESFEELPPWGGRGPRTRRVIRGKFQ